MCTLRHRVAASAFAATVFRTCFRFQRHGTRRMVNILPPPLTYCRSNLRSDPRSLGSSENCPEDTTLATLREPHRCVTEHEARPAIWPWFCLWFLSLFTSPLPAPDFFLQDWCVTANRSQTVMQNNFFLLAAFVYFQIRLRRKGYRRKKSRTVSLTKITQRLKLGKPSYHGTRRKNAQ